MLALICDSLCNGLLLATSGYAMLSLDPKAHPFGFAASAMGFCHGCAGIYSIFFDNSGEVEGTEGAKCMNHIRKLTGSCLDIITVPLANIDLYQTSEQTNALALGHGLFIIPLAFDITFKCFSAEGDEGESTAVLKDLTILGNIVSLLFFAVNESNHLAGIMALSAILANYGSAILENELHGTGEDASLVAYALFIGLMPQAILNGSGGVVGI